MSDAEQIALPTGKTGLLGGAFDPPHNGHLVVAREALSQLALERLLVVVTGAAPHKSVETPAEVRLQLAEVAFAGLENVEVSRVELDRAGLSYTLDTVRWAQEHHGDTTFIIGADEFASFLNWHEPNGVLEHARLAVATRPGFPRVTLEPVLASLEQPDRVHFFSIPEMPQSSREVRERVARHLPIDEMVPAAVAAMVHEKRLYRDEGEGERLPS